MLRSHALHPYFLSFSSVHSHTITEILERIKQLNNSSTEKSHIKEDEIIETLSNRNSGHYTNIIKIDDQYF